MFCLYEDLLASVGLCPMERKANSLRFASVGNAVGAKRHCVPAVGVKDAVRRLIGNKKQKGKAASL